MVYLVRSFVIIMKNTFGQTLRKLRDDSGMSQEELAFKTELHRTYISQLERDLKSTSLRTVSAIAAAFGLTLLQVVQRMSND